MNLSRRATLAGAAAATLVAAMVVGAPEAGAAVGDGTPSDPNVKFIGRWDTSNGAAYVSKWAGAYVKLGFTGRTVKLRQRNTIDLFASIDGGPDVAFTNVSGTVNLTPTPLAAGNHTLRVSYRPVAGSYHGDNVYQGVILDSGARTFAPSVSSRLIEFVGDSITVGQLTTKQAPTAYGWLVGDRLGAEHTQIAQGGACLVVTADGCVGLVEQFLRTGAEPASPNWDFSRYQASAVVINLGTNDVGHGVHTPEFESTYTTLLQRVRQKYPNAWIFAMETFRKRFVTQTQNAVAARNAAGDARVSFVNTEGWIVEATDTVDNVHPNDQGHIKIANRLAPIVSARLGSPAAAAAALAAGDCPRMSTASAGTEAAPVTIWMAGDSTMMNPQGGVCPTGWGSQFDPLFTDDVTVVNSAVGGRSIQTWLYDPNVTTTMNSAGECVVSPQTYSTRWQSMLTGMKAGDYLFIQFGINDGSATCNRHVGVNRFKELLTTMTQAAKARGAKPVLVTPVAAITCSGSTAVGNRGFVAETKAVASAQQVPVVDLHALSVQLYNSLRFCPNNGDYGSGPVGAFFCADHTHFETAGAQQIARLVATALRNQGIALASYLR